MSAGCPGIAWECLGTGYLIRWFTFGISRLAEVVTPQVTRRGGASCLCATGGDPLRGVIARFQVVGYPFGNLPQTFRPPQSREEGASVTPERFRVATTANQASDPSPHRTHTGTAQVIPRLYARIARSGLMGVTPAMSRIRRSRCMGVPPQWHPRRTEEHPKSA